MNYKNNLSWKFLAIFSFNGILLTTLNAFVPNLHTETMGFKTYLHFTFQANLMSLIVSVLTIQNKNSIHIQRLRILTVTSLTIAGVVFWLLLMPKRGIKHYTIFSFISTLIVHGVTPILAITSFLMKCNNNVKIKKINTIVILIIYSILWLIMAIIIYYIYDYPIYSFLNFKDNPIIKSAIYILSIIILFIYIFSSFNTHCNKYKKVNKKN